MSMEAVPDPTQPHKEDGIDHDADCTEVVNAYRMQCPGYALPLIITLASDPGLALTIAPSNDSPECIRLARTLSHDAAHRNEQIWYFDNLYLLNHMRPLKPLSATILNAKGRGYWNGQSVGCGLRMLGPTTWHFQYITASTHHPCGWIIRPVKECRHVLSADRPWSYRVHMWERSFPSQPSFTNQIWDIKPPADFVDDTFTEYVSRCVATGMDERIATTMATRDMQDRFGFPSLWTEATVPDGI